MTRQARTAARVATMGGYARRATGLEMPDVVEIVGQGKLLPPATANSSGTAMTTPIALHTA